MNQSDPTDDALAAIASILDQNTTPPEPAKMQETAYGAPEPVAETPETLPDPVPQPIEANGYFRVGPGPMAALRFRWTVREDNGRYYVDETVGDASAPIVNGPMEKDAAIRFVDDCEAVAWQRFEHFKQEMIERAAAADLVRIDDDEA